VAALALLLVACGGSPAQPSGSHATAAGGTQGGTAQAGSLAEDITFSGPVAGHLATGTPNECHFVLNDISHGTFIGQLNGKQLSFTVWVPNYDHGPGTYGPHPYSEQGLTFSLGGIGYRTRNNSKSETVDPSDFTIVVAGDLKSGTLAGRLGLYNSSDGSVGPLSESVTGRWRCG
jgi:hypothetical protein